MLNIKNHYKNTVKYLGEMITAFRLSEKIIFFVLILTIILTSLIMLNQVNSHFVKNIPTAGGSFTEGLIGSPRFINPVLELSDTDRDLTYLIYSGLMRTTADGTLIPDLAQSYNISADGLSYNFILKDDLYFHDGKKVTTDDIEYTIQMIQNVTLRSPKRNSWLGVKVEKINEKEIIFTLEKPYSPFLENTTLGILPKHIWGNASVEEFSFSSFNTEPVGSGPYEVDMVKKNSSGIYNHYQLKSFSKYALEEPYIKTIKINLYTNEKDLLNAYQTKEIESTGSITSQNLTAIKNNPATKMEKISLPRIFSLFFNQNKAKIFLYPEVRSALNLTVDKELIISEVLQGYGKTINSPLPENISSLSKNNDYIKEDRLNQAKTILEKANWKFNEAEKIWEKNISKNETLKLTFTISTSNTNDLKKTAEILKENWANLNIPVEILTFEPSDLNQSVIPDRQYDTLLFGQIVGRSLDLFAYWHSSQRNTGLNLAMYTNSKADSLLESARQIADQEERIKKYVLFEQEITKDIPAIFLYSPEFTYILPNKIQGFNSGLVNNRSERFADIYKWYIETDKVWNFLTTK